MSCIGTSRPTGSEIGALWCHRQAVARAPMARIYTTLPSLQVRGWLAEAGRTGVARRWALRPAGRERLNRWLQCPGGAPRPSRTGQFLVVLGCAPVGHADTASLLRRQIARLERSAMLLRPAQGCWARRHVRRCELALEIQREWLKSAPGSECR